MKLRERIEIKLAAMADDRLRATDWVPDFVIGRKDNPQVLRWYVIPRNRFFNIYLHCFLRSDQDFALHDHPWLFNISYIWQGMYKELYPDPEAIEWIGVTAACQQPLSVMRREGSWKLRVGPAPHRIELINEQQCWTLFMTGPKLWTWGFHCPKGWVAFKKIVKYKTNEGSEPMDGCPD